jgi:tetratricopeptide (TPR) repeat protein
MSLSHDENDVPRLAESAFAQGTESDHCPDPITWRRMATGQLTPVESETFLLHAASCDKCLSALKSNVGTAETGDEGVDLPFFPATRSPQWQHDLALRLAATPRRTSFSWIHLGRRTLGLIPIAALIVGALIVWYRHQESPDRLLAEAYAQHRIFDLRLPGARFAPVTPAVHLRNSAMVADSPLLLNARAEIARQLERSPDDPHWLELQARADLLEENYDPAVDELDRLIASGPVTAGLLVDDASAYFERGTATGSENDRAAALNNLRRADELAPDDPVVLFNEALVMEDCSQLINAVETWNRYLRFERDPEWLAEGRRRLQLLEARLDQLRSHHARMENYLATPAAMLALAADGTKLAAVDEELSTTMLPQLLFAAYPDPDLRTRGSPCPDRCESAQSLLRALAESLEVNHQDPWLHQLLPASNTPPNSLFVQAVNELARALESEGTDEYVQSQSWANASEHNFRLIGNEAGADRALLESSYDAQRLGKMKACLVAARELLQKGSRFPWIEVSALTQTSICDEGSNSATQASPLSARASILAAQHHYALLAMRSRNQIGGAAVEAGDTEDSWRILMETLRQFYAGDYPPFRAYTILAGLAEVEKNTPREQLELLIQRELLGILKLTPSRALIPAQRYDLAIAAIRAGSIAEAQAQMGKVEAELKQQKDQRSLREFLADSEIALANLYLSRGDQLSAANLLQRAQAHLAGLDDKEEIALYAAARGQLLLASGKPEAAEPLLRNAILTEEDRGRSVGAGNMIFARQDRVLYATLVATWLALDRPGRGILALWERYRLRILGQPVSPCPHEDLDCLTPQLDSALTRELKRGDQLIGVIVLSDRLLSYHAEDRRVQWREIHLQETQVLKSVSNLQCLASTPATSLPSVEVAARRTGEILLPDLDHPATSSPLLLIESDPLIGNLPWPAVESASGPIGLRFDLDEVPSLLLAPRRSPAASTSSALIVGASIGAGAPSMLSSALDEARSVALFEARPDVLLGRQATQDRVARDLRSAALIHFAGHAARHNGETRLLLAPSGLAGDRPFVDEALLRANPPRKACLVVLSACATGQSQPGWDHGTGDMVDELTAMGVPQIVATRWPIESTTAVTLMRAFYSNLATGESAPAALTDARRVVAASPRSRHPFYWAAYDAFGAGHSDLHSIFDGKTH